MNAKTKQNVEGLLQIKGKVDHLFELHLHSSKQIDLLIQKDAQKRQGYSERDQNRHTTRNSDKSLEKTVAAVSRITGAQVNFEEIRDDEMEDTNQQAMKSKTATNWRPKQQQPKRASLKNQSKEELD